MNINDILFRGKRLDNGEWVEGWIYWVTKGAYLTPIQNGCYVQTFQKLNNGEIILTGVYEVNPATVGQYVGTLDKNGKKIFKDDIVKYVFFGMTHIHNVEYDNALCGYYAGQQPPNQEMEIIGNIHDNPDLLEGEQ